MRYQLRQDGLRFDVLDEEGKPVLASAPVEEVLDFFEDLETPPDSTIIRVLAGTLDHDDEEEVLIDDLIDELVEAEG